MALCFPFSNVSRSLRWFFFSNLNYFVSVRIQLCLSPPPAPLPCSQECGDHQIHGTIWWTDDEYARGLHSWARAWEAHWSLWVELFQVISFGGQNFCSSTECLAYWGKKLLPPGWKNSRPSPSFLWLPNSESQWSQQLWDGARIPQSPGESRQWGCWGLCLLRARPGTPGVPLSVHS